MATLEESIFTALLADSTLMGLLAGDTGRVLAVGQADATGVFPLLVVCMDITTGNRKQQPIVESTFEVRAYAKPEARNRVSWTEPNSLLNRARAVLHGASLSAASDSLGVFETAWEFRSRDIQDFNLKAWYRYDRYRSTSLFRLPYYASV